MYKRLLISFFENLRGSRLLLRGYNDSDAHDFFEAFLESRERLRPWDDWPDKGQTIDDIRAWLREDMANWLLRKHFEIGIWIRESDSFVGSISLRPQNWDIPSFEIGYWIRTSAEGKGYMTEALTLLIDYLFESQKAKRVMLRIDARNTRSIALAERLHFQQEGILRNCELATDGTLRNMIFFALTPEDWDYSTE
jgi:ribosomal-protein-serine acetyltransferase